jgi:hypothetical protein
MKKYATFLYTGLILAGLGSSVWRLANPIKAAATTCNGISCWTSGGGAAWKCTDANRNCTAGCDGNYCNNVL